MTELATTPEMIGRWKNIPIRMCINHPDIRHKANGLCANCCTKKHYAANQEYRAKSMERAAQWRKDNPKRSLEITRRSKSKACPVKKKNYLLKRKYGITIEQYEQMLAEQGGVCAICGQEPASGKSLHVDHCHKTGIVRGLLCHQCNWYLGKIDNIPGLMDRLGQYLERAE